MRTRFHHHTSQKPIRFVDRRFPTVHRRYPTREKGIGVNHHSSAFEVDVQQEASWLALYERRSLGTLARLERRGGPFQERPVARVEARGVKRRRDLVVALYGKRFVNGPGAWKGGRIPVHFDAVARGE